MSFGKESGQDRTEGNGFLGRKTKDSRSQQVRLVIMNLSLELDFAQLATLWHKVVA
jgi:hypothetical protein